MKKKLLATMLVLCLVLCLSAAVSADVTYGTVEKITDGAVVEGAATAKQVYPANAEVHEAKIGNLGYETLSEAVAAAKAGDTVTVLKDIDLNENLIIGADADVVLDLNGKTLNMGSNAIVDNGKLTVKDSTVAAVPSVGNAPGYKVTYVSGKVISSGYVVKTKNGGSFTLKSGTIQSTGNCGVSAGAGETIGMVNIDGGYVVAQEFGSIAFNEGSKIAVNGGVIEAKDNAVLGGNGTKGMGGYTIDVKGGTLIGRIETSGYASCGIYHPNEGTVNVSGGTIISTNGAGIVARAGQTNVTGGEIIALGDAEALGKVGDSKVVVSVSGIVLDLAAKYPGAGVVDGKATNADVAVSGDASVFGIKSAVDVVETYGDSTVEEDSNVEISGGTFSHSVSDYVIEALNVELIKATGETPYRYFADTAAAKAAAESGDSIKDLATNHTADVYSITVASDMVNGKVVADAETALEGGTVTITVTPDEGYKLKTLTVAGEGKLVVDTVDKGNGKYTFTMPASDVTVSASFVKLPCDGGAKCPSKAFSDLDVTKWYHKATDYAITHHLMEGVGGNVFDPNATLSRAMMVQILYNNENKPAVDTKESFSDVKDGDWFKKAVLWGVDNGIVFGYEDNTFRPNQNITREEMVTILYRYARFQKQDVTVNEDLAKYADAGKVQSYAKDAFRWAVGNGIVNGMDTTPDTIAPQGNATRAQAAQVLMKYLDREAK